VFFLLQGKGFGNKTRILIVILCILAPVIGGAYEFEGSRWQAAEQWNFAGRERIVPSAWQMFEEKPFWGWGPATNVRELGQRTSGAEVLDTHNLPLWLLTEVGLVGAIPFLVGWILCLALTWKTRNGHYGMMPFALNLGFFLTNQANTLYNLKLFWIILAIGVGCGTYSVYHRGGVLSPARLPGRRWRRFAWETGARS
jgi:O-antigen ligase